jgi:hypothetical protein
MHVFSNLSGTTSDSFRISNSGPTIHAGVSQPASALGKLGDVFILLGASPKILIKNETGWDRIVTEEQSFFRAKISTSAFIASNEQYYLGVATTGPVSIYLPSGRANKRFIVKDETGQANRTITIFPSANETIDGQTQFELASPYASINMVYGDEWHVF